MLTFSLAIKIPEDWLGPWRLICLISTSGILTISQTRETLLWAKRLLFLTVRRISLSNEVITLIQKALNIFPRNRSHLVGVTAVSSLECTFHISVFSNFLKLRIRTLSVYMSTGVHASVITDYVKFKPAFKSEFYDSVCY